MIDPHIRCRPYIGLGAEGHAHSGSLDHADVVGAIANRDGIGGGEAETLGEFAKGCHF